MNDGRNAKILIIDDETGVRFSLRGILEDEGYRVFEAENGETGLQVLEKEEADLVFLDIWLPGIDGPQVLEKIKATRPSLPVLMISGHATIEHAVQAIKQGAHDFIEKPLSLEKVLISVARALEFRELQRENLALRSTLPEKRTETLQGESQAIMTLRRYADMVAPLDTWVLITGENGTGKEVAARYIQAASNRDSMPMVAVNCAAIPEELIESELFGHEKGAFTGAENTKIGKFELAHQGTLFLDEIGDMSVKTQAKILRILQEQKFERVGGNRTIRVDVRVIAATNKNLEEAIAKGDFRQDLYYRLRVFPLHMPPLRERGGDILLMLQYFTRRFQQEYRLKPMSFDQSASFALLHYSWPGNVRELRNFAERMIIMYEGQNITAAMLPPEILRTAEFSPPQPAEQASYTGLPAALRDNDFKAMRNAFEVLYLQSKYREFGGNISKMAEAIGLERSYLHRKLKSVSIPA
ncbi:MAG: sigma-54 dependent transcriptional regulator [Deltaproteobacteria bacterium]|jgi:two-component system nitrogen regulation response regulator NtrX|nr:sigma-54 dependent transcriptional regulator [Deltaproteobacteria bacterium]